MLPDVLPEQRSRLPLVGIAALGLVLVAVAVTAVVVLVRSGGASGPTAEISHLTPDMLLDQADVAPLTGASWQRQFKDISGPDGPTDKLKVTPAECASPMHKGARQIGTAQWTSGDNGYGVSLSVPTPNDTASLSRWVDSCSTFRVADVTTGSVRRLALPGVPSWAVAYTVTIGVSPGGPETAGVIGVHRGVMIHAFYGYHPSNGAPADPRLRDGLPKMFSAEVIKVDDV